MNHTIPQPLTPKQTARARRCPLCGAKPRRPCQRKPPADHLARFLDAYTAGQLSRAYMTMVLGELVAIRSAAMVPDGAR